MLDVIGKVRALLALTASNNIDEARNAALAMANLIRVHNILLVQGPQGIGTTFPAPSPPVRPPRAPPSNSRTPAERTAANKAADAFTASWKDEVRARQRAVGSKPRASSHVQAEAEIEAEKWRPMKAKFPGICKGCRKAIVRDASIVWHLEKGAFHIACFNKANKA